MTHLRPLLALALALSLAAGCSVDFNVGARAADVGPDASSNADGGTDAASTDGGVDGWCKGKVAEFCADFETGDVASGWDNQITVGGKVELDPTRGFESARSAVFLIQSGAESATLVKKLPGPWRPTTVELATFVASPTSDNAIALLQLTLSSDVTETTATSPSFLLLVSREGTTLLVRTPDPHPRASTKPFPFDRWVHVTFTVDWDKKSAAFALDGEPVVTYDDFPWTVPSGSLFETQLRLGAVVVPSPTAAPTVNHDDVLVVRR